MQKTTVSSSNEPATLGKTISLATAGIVITSAYMIYSAATVIGRAYPIDRTRPGQLFEPAATDNSLAYRLACAVIGADLIAIVSSAALAVMLIWTFRRSAAKAAIFHYLIIFGVAVEHIVVAMMLDYYSATNIIDGALANLVASTLYSAFWIAFFLTSKKAKNIFIR